MKQQGITINDSIAQMIRRSKNRTAVSYKKKNHWIKVNWHDYYEKIAALSLSLLKKGVERKTRVAILSDTRFEWGITDASLFSIGAVVVPLYPSLSKEDLLYILNDSACEYLFVENRKLLKNILEIKNEISQLKKIILFDSTRVSDSQILNWESLLEEGSQLLRYERSLFEDELRKAQPQDVATIVYTSGTQGTPKGVVLSHTQIISEIADTFPLLGAHPDDVFLSFLPYSHVLGRVENWGHWFVGFELAYAESLDKLRKNILEVNPTILMSVPRVFEKMYILSLTQIKKNKITKFLFEKALEARQHQLNYKHLNEPIPLHTWGLGEFAYLLLKPIQSLFGRRFRFAVCGGAALPLEVSQFFHAAGILILEGYGLTETTAAITVNRPFDFELGTVGKPIGDVQIRLNPDGEILVQSKKIMLHYLNQKKQTQDVLKNGWFHTGDIGEWTTKGNLKITDRKKDLIKTSGGKYVAPQKLIQLIKSHPLISHVSIHGNNKKFIAALITLDESALKIWAESKLIPFKNTKELTQHEITLNEIKKHIAKVNLKLSNFETIKRFSVLEEDFSIEKGEITPSLKLKKSVIEENYKFTIERLFDSTLDSSK